LVPVTAALPDPPIAWTASAGSRATGMIICPDTAPLVATPARLAESGNAQAEAAPITD